MRSLLLLIVVVVVLAGRLLSFSSSLLVVGSGGGGLDFARRNDSSAVTVKRVRFETSPRVTSESLPSVVVVVVVAFSLDVIFVLSLRHVSRV